MATHSNILAWEIPWTEEPDVLLFATPWIVAHHAPLPIEFSRLEYWNGLLFPPPGDLPDPGIEPTSLASPALVGGFFTTNATWGEKQGWMTILDR